MLRVMLPPQLQPSLRRFDARGPSAVVGSAVKRKGPCFRARAGTREQARAPAHKDAQPLGSGGTVWHGALTPFGKVPAHPANAN